MRKTLRSLGQIAYDAYGDAGQWTTFDGRPMPLWHELTATQAGRETQARWHIAANAVGAQYTDKVLS